MPPTPPSPPRGRSRRVLLIVAGVALGALALVVGLLPRLAGTAAGKRLILARIAAALAPGRVEVDHFAISWSRPTRLVGFKLIAPDGVKVVTAPVAELDRSLGQMIFARTAPATLTLDRAKVAIRHHPDGKLDLVEALRGVIAHPDPTRDLTVRIKDGTLAIRASGLDDPILARGVDLDLAIPPAPRALSWTLKLAHPDGGDLVIKGDTNRWTARDNDPSLADLRLDVAARRWPVANRGGGINAAGWLDGTAEVARRSERWSIETTARVLDLGVTGPGLSGDTFRPGSIAIACDVAQNADWWKIRRLTIDSAVASARGEGWLGTDPGTDARGEARRIEARVDLAALAKQIPHTLRLRPDLVVDRGSIRFVAESTGPLDHSTTTLEATIADLAARDGDRPVGLRDPAILSARVIRRGDEVTIEGITARTSFFNAAVAGKLDDATLTGSVDLGALRGQLGEWFDLGDLAAAGRADLAGSYRVATRRFEAGLDLKARDLRIEGATAEPIRRPLSTVRLAATGAATATGWPESWQTAAVDVGSGESSGHVELQRTDAAIAVGARLDIGLAGDDPRRRVEASLAGSWDKSRHLLACDRIAARLTPAPTDGAGRLDLVARGEINPTAGTIRLEPIGSTGAAPGLVRLAPGGIKVSGLGRNLATLRVDAALEGDLAGTSPGAGMGWTAAVNAAGEGRDLSFRTTAAARSRDAAPTVGPVAALTMGGRYVGAEDRLEVAEWRVDSRFGGMMATGHVDDPVGARRFAVEGRLTPDFAAITAWLKDHVEPGAVIAGQPRSFTLRGTASGADPAGTIEGEVGFDLAEADVYGMKLGSTPIVVRANGGRVLVDPISTTLNEGHIRLEPEVLVHDSKGDPVLRLGKNSTIRDARINDEVSRRVLAFVAPILEGTTRASGRVSVDVDHAEIPLRSGRSRSAQLDGQVVFADVAFEPGPLANDLLGAIGRRDSSLKLDRPVTFTIADGRINQSGLALPIGDLTRIELAGWVDFDRNLALTATLPVTAAMLGNNPLLSDIAAGTQIRLPIGGTLNSPRIDRDAFADGLKDLGKSLLTRGATRGALELLKRFGQPQAGNDAADPAPPPPTAAERKALRQERRADRKSLRGGTPAPTPTPEP